MKGSLEEPSRKALKLVPSSWLTTLTIKKYDFCLDKQSFWDSLYIRYNIPLKRNHYFVFMELHSSLNMLCYVQKVDICQSDITEVIDFTAEILSECYKDLNTARITTTNRWNSTTISKSNKWSSAMLELEGSVLGTSSVLWCKGVQLYS